MAEEPWDEIEEEDEWEDDEPLYTDDGEVEGSFDGKPIMRWQIGEQVQDWENIAIKIRVASYAEVEDEDADNPTWEAQFEALLAVPGSERLTTLVVGAWQEDSQDASHMVKALTAAAERLPNLRALYVGDMTYEESELSWIRPGDLSPLLRAYPRLHSLYIHGANALSLGELDMPELQELTIFSGGLSGSAVREVMRGKLPALAFLELYLGVENYGGDATPEDIAPILHGNPFPRLRHLGLKNSERQDEFAQVIAQAPILGRLESLDLSEGTLSDEGARALLASPLLRNLKKLDVGHNYCSEEVLEEFRALPLEVNCYAEGDPDDDRFVSFSE